MARKRADIGELARSLKTPAFGNRGAEQTAITIEPVSPTVLVLSLAEIKSYEHNPRRAENPEFYRLKDSIASRRGLTTPLSVTKRPGDARFTIAAGGNSRLRVLNELYDETGDQIFNRVMCQFEPWDSDCQVLANHLIENDVRGNMTFADKAQAVVQWQQLYEAAHPEAPSLSQRVLEEKLGETGFAVSHGLLARYLYTAEFLLPALPNALASGLGRPQIEQLIRLRTFAEQYWDEVPLPDGLTPSASFGEVFVTACAAEDRHADDWAFDFFQSALATRIAESLSLDPKVVALDLDSLYHGIPVGQLGSQVLPQHEDKPQFAFERAREHRAAQVERARHRQAALDGELGENSGTSTGPRHVDADLETAFDAALSALSTVRTIADLQAPRASIYELAHTIAVSHGLNELVKPCDVGYGFYIDAPEPPETVGEHTVAYSGIRLWLWWWLSLSADELDAAHLSAIGGHDANSWLFQLFDQLPKRAPGKDFLDALHLLVGQPDWLKLNDELFTNAAIAEDDFVRLIALLRHCRALRLAAERADIGLWERSR